MLFVYFGGFVGDLFVSFVGGNFEDCWMLLVWFGIVEILVFMWIGIGWIWFGVMVLLFYWIGYC